METTRQHATEGRIEIGIKGMSCGGCARGVANSLSAIKGVLKADVDFANAKATVLYQPQHTNPEAILASVKGMGYEATVG